MAYLPVYICGRAPCGDNCPLEWAVDAADVVIGSPIPMTLPTGTILKGMAYAGPTWTESSYVLSSPHSGVGYRLPDGGYFVKLDCCGNWTRAYPQFELGAIPEFVNAIPLGTTPPSTPFHAQADLGHLYYSFGSRIDDHVLPPVYVPDPVAPIPLPPSIFLLVAALFALRRLKP